MIRILLAMAGAMILTTGGAQAQDYRQGDLIIEGVWARPTPGASKMGAAYLTVKNEGKEPDTLTAATAEFAEKVEVHQNTKNDQGVMQMRAVEGGLEIPAGKTVALKPGGLHIMFVGLKQKLEDGQSVPLTLQFAKAGEVKVDVKVEHAAAMKKKDEDQGSHSGH